MSYNVSRRTHELGIRLALGANDGEVVWLVLSQGLKLVLAGALAGLLESFGLTRLLANQLYGITATDPVTFVGVIAVLGAVAMAACYFPARKSGSLDRAAVRVIPRGQNPFRWPRALRVTISAAPPRTHRLPRGSRREPCQK